MNPLAVTPARVAFAGDWHGNDLWAKEAIQYARVSGAQAILHAGDFGYMFTHQYLSAVDDALHRNRLFLMFVDGNHENHTWLGSQPIDKATGLRRLAGRVWHVPRGFSWRWGPVKFAGLGGAVSIDKLSRVEGVSWWPQEAITVSQVRKTKRVGQVDVLLTHDCPDGVLIPGLSDYGMSASWKFMLDECDANRRKLRGVVNAVKPGLVVHGHYHVPYMKRVVSRSARGGANIVHTYHVLGLDCDNRTLANNIRVFDLEDLRRQDDDV